jgi:Flp pilus assembly protein TadG
MQFRPARVRLWDRWHSAVVIAVALPTLVGIASLGADLGDFYFNRSLLQNAADAAVRAGSAYLPTNPELAIQIANDSAASNGIVRAEIVSTAVSGDNQQIQVRLERAVPFFYARVFGFGGAVVSAQATGGLVAVGNPPKARPGDDSSANRPAHVKSR